MHDQRPGQADLIVIGSGAAGLAAALTAARAGASVCVLEAGDLLGGTTTFSGALLWAPFNRWQRGVGEKDSPEIARAYVRRCLGERASDPRWEVFFNTINQTIEELLVEECGMEFVLTRYPDSYGEWPEGRDNRHINAKAFPLSRAGEWAPRVRSPAFAGMSMMTIRDVERAGWVRPTAPQNIWKLLPALVGNAIGKKRGMGHGLIVAMVAACLRRNVRFELNARVGDLIMDGGRVAGVRYEQDGRAHLAHARRGVVIAAGGFGWDEALKREHLPAPYDLPQEPPTNLGDGLRLAAKAGADLRYLDEAWYLPSSPFPAPYMGKHMGQTLVMDRMLPHQIWVNQSGARFVNEAGQNAAEAFRMKDAQGRLPNYPAFSVFDQQYRDKYSIYVSHGPKSKGPDELLSADTLEGLAQRIGVNTHGLLETVRRYNALVSQGRDTDFGRGDGAYERYFCGREGSLGTIEKPPFYALPVHTGGVGTKGGAMTDAHARVLRPDGVVIPGLYAAGNASAAFNGPITVAAGCTIPPALVMGRAGALHAIGART